MSENRAKRKVAVDKYRTRNAERLRAYRAARYVEKKTAINAASKAWRKKNPEKVREFSHARRTRLRGQGGRYTPKDIERIKTAQRGKCAICRIALSSAFHRDHIVPISKGGSNAARNIQLTCDQCNLAKHSKDPTDFMRERGLLL